jgi:ethanolamine utilization protein EutP (predicted NTPase)
MWISLDVLNAALLVNLCEFKVLILLRCFVHKRYHFTPSFQSIALLMNGIKTISNILRATTTEDSTPGGMEVRYLLKQVKYYQ